jgi:lipoprotein NlpD
MDFNVSSAQSVKSASAGQVVYAGSGIGGFAKLVIVRHSESLLSAYSFNGEARVQESQRVIAGETLAEVTPRGRAKQVLHFEIRRDGEPVNPRSVIN